MDPAAWTKNPAAVSRSRKDCFMSETKASRQRDAVAKTARSVAQVWEDRTALVKQEVAAESAANDAKTARLRALRLEKEAQEAEALRLAPKPAPAKKRIRRIVAD
jgi:hypothetical protein